MGGFERIAVPATDVPVRHYFNGLVNTAIFHNRSTVGRVYLVFDDGLQKILAATEIWEVEAADTSAQQDTGKLFGSGYYVIGDAVHAQEVEVVWTTKAPIRDREPVTV